MVDEITPLRRRKVQAPEFPEGFDVGALVALNSGGAIMTLTAKLPGEPLAVHCEWHSTDGYPLEKSYPVACLRVVREADMDDEVEE